MAAQNNSDIFRTLKIIDEIGFTNKLIFQILYQYIMFHIIKHEVFFTIF